ncbi:hypothetical protein ElyMa_004448100 [Elysia marginata]|uniref:Uncharacterized protein n=1 Tax=Elysia marginata TaxID=1093978 RepID=A0AAV4HHY4_9GAST|nr:hypothetical protein ElyMa_004448100 [Elysia marginata]
MEFLRVLVCLILFVSFLTTAPWCVNNGQAVFGVSGLDVSAEDFSSKENVTVMSTNEPANNGDNRQTSSQDRGIKEKSETTTQEKKEKGGVELVEAGRRQELISRPEVDGIRESKDDTEQNSIQNKIRENGRTRRESKESKNKNGVRKKSRLGRAGKGKAKRQNPVDAPKSQASFGNSHSFSFSSTPEKPPFSGGVTDGSFPLYDAITGEKFRDADLSRATSSEIDDTDLTNQGHHALQKPSGVGHDLVEDDLHHPLGEEYARIHESILKGIVPPDMASSIEQDHPAGGAGNMWAMGGFEPHPLPDGNLHPLSIPAHQVDDTGIHGIPFGQDVGLNHPFSSSDLSHSMGGNVAPNDIAFDFGAFDLDGHNQDTRECFEVCRCHGVTVSCFWCNLTQVPVGISPATKTL